MADPMPLDPEERRLRAAQRFWRFGVTITVLWFLLPLVVFIGPPAPGFTVALVGLGVVALGLHLSRIRKHVSAPGVPVRWWFTVSALAVGLAVTLVGLASGYGGSVWSVIGGVLLSDVVAGLPARRVAGWVGAAMAVTVGAGYVVSVPVWRDAVIPIGPWPAAGLAAFYVGIMWTIDGERLWWLRAVTDLDGSRRVAAELATARERARLGDDLHDILGHALEVVAFKSELAGRLLDAGTGAGTDRARAELDEVQRVARQSLSEVRALVRDTRSTDLVSELNGARAVLDSAGVRLEVRGDPEGVAAHARPVLGRVLREAMTNVLRHSRPHTCSIEIEVTDERARLRVVNDGVLPPDPADTGTGLPALRRHLESHAGSLDAGLLGSDRFQLDATVPAGGA